MSLLTVEEAVQRLSNVHQEHKGSYRGPCPAHGGQDNNFVIFEREDGFAGFKCYSHDCHTEDISKAIRAIKPNGAPVVVNKNYTNSQDSVKSLWNQTQPISGSVGEKYFWVRGIRIPLPDTLRFHPNLAYYNDHEPTQYFPAVVAAVSNADTANVHALARIYLKRDHYGKASVKNPKKSLGSLDGGTVRMAPCSDSRLILTEGLEDALTLQQQLKIPAWATLGWANLRHVKLPELPRAKEILFGCDADRIGVKAAEEAADVFRRQGRGVRLLIPPDPYKDFNDVLKAELNL